MAEAIGLATMGVAELFGQTAQFAALYALVRDFLLHAYTSLQTLFGQALTQMVGDQVAGWIKEAPSDKRFVQQVDKLYATTSTGKALAKVSAESSVDLPNYIAAIQADLVDTFEQRVQRPQQRQVADQYDSGKKKQHTLKSQVAIDEVRAWWSMSRRVSRVPRPISPCSSKAAS